MGVRGAAWATVLGQLVSMGLGLLFHLHFNKEISNSFPGVEKSFAIQSGREVRIMVKPEDISDEGTYVLAREVAKRIENELEYPGQIKVNVIRETRCTEFAK